MPLEAKYLVFVYWSFKFRASLACFFSFCQVAVSSGLDGVENLNFTRQFREATVESGFTEWTQLVHYIQWPCNRAGCNELVYLSFFSSSDRAIGLYGKNCYLF